MGEVGVGDVHGEWSNRNLKQTNKKHHHLNPLAADSYTTEAWACFPT